MIKTLTALVAILLTASFGLNAQPKLSDQAKIESKSIPSLRDVPVGVELWQQEEFGREQVYKLGAREIKAECPKKGTWLCIFFTEAVKTQDMSQSWTGWSANGHLQLVDAYAIIVRDGKEDKSAEVARGNGHILAGTESGNGVSRTFSDEQAVFAAEKQAVRNLFKKSAWHLGAAEILRKEFGPKMSATQVATATAPTIAISPELDALNAKALELSAKAAQIEAEARTAELAAKTAEADKRKIAEEEKKRQKEIAATEKRIKEAEKRLADATKKVSKNKN